MSEASGSLAGQKVAVIGGASGIGLAVAKGALASGAEVVIGSSRAENVEAGLKDLPGAHGHVVDARNESSIAAFFAEVGAFHHLAFTAGDRRSFIAPAATLDIEQAAAGMNVRFWGAVRAAKRALPTIAQNGSMTFTGGVLAHRPMKGAPLTTASAGALEHLVRGLAIDLAPIRVNAVAPGLILTDLVKDMGQETIDSFTRRLPLPRPGAPEEAAEAYLYLMRGGYTTGQVLLVDGGGVFA